MSTAATLRCTDDRVRRGRARAAGLFGLDYVEVGPSGVELIACFIGKAPPRLGREQLQIEGGRQITGITVTGVRIEREPDPERDDRMIVTLSQSGDFSTYTLRIVAARPGADRAEIVPIEAFDPRYLESSFGFAPSCGGELDCLQTEHAPPDARAELDIDYLAKDYASFRQVMLDRLSVLLPDWQERHVPDLGIALVELIAYVADRLSYEQDAVATEAYLDTARTRIAVRRHLRLVDYVLGEGANARAWVAFRVSQDISLEAGTFFVAAPSEPGSARAMSAETWADEEGTRRYVFEPLGLGPPATLRLLRAHNEIRLHSWDGQHCCIPRGATRATVLDPGVYAPSPGRPDGARAEAPEDAYRLRLRPAMVLIFEEVKGAKTGVAADADPTHRHAVCLTRVERAVDPVPDPVTGQPRLLWHLTWHDDDALPFPVCITSVGAGPRCDVIADVSVLSGNVCLFDEGRTREEELGSVPEVVCEPPCADDCGGSEPARRAGPFRPRLQRAGLVYSEPHAIAHARGSSSASAAAALRRDPSRAVPAVELLSHLPKQPNRVERWTARVDLLASEPSDRHFVVEMDDERGAWLRFGDGQLGRAPEPGVTFRARYRTGAGAEGNLGADRLTQLVFTKELPSGVEISVRNPLPAQGGQAAEPVAKAKLRGPHAIHGRLERAITPDDYAAIVLRDFSGLVQRAAATRRWTGRSTEILVVLDAFERPSTLPRGEHRTPEEATSAQLRAVRRHLERYRRIGHELRVAWATPVPLRVELSVCVRPRYLRGAVEGALLEVLGNRRRRDGSLGFFHPDRLLLGQRVRSSELVAAAQGVVGVAHVRLSALERYFDGPDGELERGYLKIGALEVARLDNDAGSPEHGVLRLALEGGR